MKEKILLISNTNLFSVMSRMYLNNLYDCFLLNVRYPNENFSREQNFVQQAKEVYQERLITRGIIASKHSYPFNEKCTNRIMESVKNFKPKLIFFEMVSFDEAEWLTLKFLSTQFKLPISIYTNIENNSLELDNLLGFGVKDILLTMDETTFLRAAKRGLSRYVE